MRAGLRPEMGTVPRWSTSTATDIWSLRLGVRPTMVERGRTGDIFSSSTRNRTFTEAAAQYGIADSGFTTHAVFLD